MARRRRKQRHHHKKALAPRIHRRRRRRRSNPSTLPVLLANPRRRRRRGRKHTHWGAVIAHRRKTNPHRRRRHAARRHRLYSPMVHRIRRRRGNPHRLSLGSMGKLARIALFGGLGVVTARIGAFLYTKFLSDTVSGADGKANPTGLRGTLNEAARLLAMGVFTLGVERAVSKVRLLGIGDCYALKIGGLAETGRQAVGVVIKRLSPQTDLERFGLNGMGELESDDSFAGLQPSGAFGELEPGDSFAGVEEQGLYAYEEEAA